MQLVRFSRKCYEEVKDRPVYIIGGSEDLLRELCDTYDILGNIRDIIRKVRIGRIEIDQKTFAIKGREGLYDLPENAVFIIVNYAPKEHFAWLSKTADIHERFPVAYFFCGKEMEYNLSYREKYRDTPLKDLILFRSGPGMSVYARGCDFADNARALFEYMLREKWDERYELVWMVNDPEEFSSRYAMHPRVRFLPFRAATSDDAKERDAYYEALCLAKYIFFTESHMFARGSRPDQTRVQLWHGHGFKSRMAKRREEHCYEYMTVTSRFYGKLHAKIFGLRSDQILVTGCPKEDWLYHPIANWKERFHLPKADKYIFWLPTFRTPKASGLQYMQETVLHRETGLPILESMEMIRRLNDELQRRNVLLIIKLHPFQDRDAVAKWNLSHIRLLEVDALIREDVQIHELLGHADALISDYSSIVTDYMLLDRPIAFTLDDCEEYRAHRGFHWKKIHDYLPGIEIYNFNDIINFIDDIKNGRDTQKNRRKNLMCKFHNFNDDKNALRILKALGI